MIRKMLLGGLLAAPLLFGATTAQAQVIDGDSGQSNSQSIGATQNGAKSQNSVNNANSSQDVGAGVIIGDVDQTGQQDIATTQTGGKSLNSTNNANNRQSVGSLILIGDTAQGNKQDVRTKQSTKSGFLNSSNNLNNAQIIAVDVIIGDRDQDNDQQSVTDQTQSKKDSSGSTIVLGDFIEISVDDDLPSVDLPGLEIDPVGNNGANSSGTAINNSQVILGAT